MEEEHKERTKTAEEERYSYAGLVEKDRIKKELKAAEQGAQERPDDATSGLRLEVAQKKMELFEAEHDNAGAFKFKKFGRRIQELFEPGADGKPAIGRGEDGELVMAESLKERRFMMVNMGELDRFNKEGGGHAAGDQALGATAGAVEKAVTEALGIEQGEISADYQIYRYDGNTFMVDIASMPKEEFDALLVKMQGAQPRVEGVKDPAPLTVRSLELGHVVETVNHVQAKLAEGAKLAPGEDAARELVEVMRRTSDWDMEVNKVFNRAERIRLKIGALGFMPESATAEERKAAEAEVMAFFKNYAEKSFQGTEFATYEGFKQTVEDGRYLAVAEQIATQASEKRFADGRKVDDKTTEIIDARVRSRNIPQDLTPMETISALRQSSTKTEGERILDEKRGTMLVMEQMAAAPSGAEAEMLGLRAQSARLEYQIETARRDMGTGLLERGVHYEDLEKGIEEGKDVATVFVDMGFLKYFDQMGGSDVGDAALKTAASMMEQALQASGEKGNVYRYGGDEFTIQVEGGAAAADKVIRALETIRAASDPIAASTKSRSEYAPTQLSFNYGLSDKTMLDDLHGLAVREGKYTPEELGNPAVMRNKKAELMTKAADVGIEYNKAYSRFMLLIEKMREPGADDKERKPQIEALITFSNKAIFNELGGTEKLRELARSGLEGEALEEEVLDYVVDKVAETRARDKGKKELVDLLIAAQVKVSFLTDRLRDMEGIASIQEHKITALQSSLRKAEDEKRQLIETRGQIDRAA